MRTLNVAEIIIFTALAIISLFFAINNGIILLNQIKKRSGPSVAPFIGGVTGAIIVLLFFQKKYWGMIFIPLLLDYGSIPIICKFLYLFIKDSICYKK